ncbi:hypothetical protein CJ469_04981 [Nocardia farcinica]|nr:hypothetical protein CJ469_04981 [Nocardia farcinica]PFX06596.1 hypothetical protein CJ468_04361 [Nocardia farcinica]
MSEERDWALGPEHLEHLLVPRDGKCWWCRQRPANTSEHKFKASDLSRLMTDDGLIWGDDDGLTRTIRGKSGITRDRHGVVKFPKSLCDRCNNSTSQPFDLAYDRFAEYLSTYWVRIMPGIDFTRVYGVDDWEPCLLNLARYHGKHFGCQMARLGLPIPDSLRAFLDGNSDMHDIHMVLITNDAVHKQYGKGLSIAPGIVRANRDKTMITGCVFAAYVGSVGVRFEWYLNGIPDESRSQFFHHKNPVLNCFTDDKSVVYGTPRKPGWFARFSQWANKPRSAEHAPQPPLPHSRMISLRPNESRTALRASATRCCASLTRPTSTEGGMYEEGRGREVGRIDDLSAGSGEAATGLPQATTRWH